MGCTLLYVKSFWLGLSALQPDWNIVNQRLMYLPKLGTGTGI